MSSTQSATLSRHRPLKVVMVLILVLTLCHISHSPQRALKVLLYQLFPLSLRSYAHCGGDKILEQCSYCLEFNLHLPRIRLPPTFVYI